MSDFTAEQKLFLASSAEFQALIASDSVLAELDASRIDYALEGLLLWDAIGGLTEICGMKVSPITPAIWSNLWLLRNPLATGKKPEFQDVCEAVYMLTHSVADTAAEDFAERAKKYAEEVSLTPEIAPDVWGELCGMVKTAFSPLKMLPQTQGNGEPVFDADWLLSVCSVVANEAGITLRDAALNFPLSSAFGLMVIRARKANPGATYSKHTPEWIEKRVMERVHELGEAFLEERGEA
jgi:hypothetical protein